MTQRIYIGANGITTITSFNDFDVFFPGSSLIFRSNMENIAREAIREKSSSIRREAVAEAKVAASEVFDRNRQSLIDSARRAFESELKSDALVDSYNRQVRDVTNAELTRTRRDVRTIIDQALTDVAKDEKLSYMREPLRQEIKENVMTDFDQRIRRTTEEQHTAINELRQEFDQRYRSLRNGTIASGIGITLVGGFVYIMSRL